MIDCIGRKIYRSKIDIGRKLLTDCQSPLLYTGMMQASFNLSENIPQAKDWFIILDRGSQINSFISLHNFVGILLIP